MKKPFFFFFFLIILISYNSYGLGVGQEYIKDNTLELYPGQERIVKLTIQNPDENEIKVNVSLIGEIAKINNHQETYLIPARSYDNPILINITVPKDAKINNTYTIRYSLAPVLKNESSQSIRMAMKISQPIYIKVIPEPIVEYDWTPVRDRIIWSFGILLLIFVFWRLAKLTEKKINKF